MSRTHADIHTVDGVSSVLGTTKTVANKNADIFYERLNRYVNSTEKKDKKKEKSMPLAMEYWPLIKVVRIYTKADALSTAAVIVDLPKFTTAMLPALLLLLDT